MIDEKDDRYTTLPFDQRGHQLFGDGTTVQAITASLKLRERFLAEHGNDDPSVYPISMALVIGGHRQCSYCGKRPRLDFIDGVVIAGNECTAGDIVNVFDLVVTSGRIIVSDDLRPQYEIPDDVERTLPDYNMEIGQAAYSQEMAKIGCAYGAVGNSSPSLYKTGDGTYIIANPGWSMDDNGDDVDVPVDGEELANICTDLWAYSIADYDDWVSKGGEVTSWTQTVVEIPNGTYRFTHHTGERGFTDMGAGVTIYAHIEKIA